MMTCLRRHAVWLIVLLCSQFALAANGVACVRQTDAAAQARMATDMPRMDMAPSSTQAPAHSERHPQPPCDRPFGPDNCQPLSACAPAIAVPPAPSATRSMRVRSDMLPLVVLAPAARATPPDLPPPRA